MRLGKMLWILSCLVVLGLYSWRVYDHWSDVATNTTKIEVTVKKTENLNDRIAKLEKRVAPAPAPKKVVPAPKCNIFQKCWWQRKK